MSRCRKHTLARQSRLLRHFPVAAAFLCCSCAILGTIGRPTKPSSNDDRNPLMVIEANNRRMIAELYEGNATNVVDYFMYLVEKSQAYVPAVRSDEPIRTENF